MKKILLIVLLLSITICFNNLMAQKDTLKNEVADFGFMFFPIEFPSIENDALNEQLQAFGFPSANYPKACIGVGWQASYNRYIATFSFNQTTKRNVQSDYLSKTSYRSFSLNIGYDLLKYPYFSIYPYAGYKSGRLNYLCRDALTSESSFDNYFKTDLKYKEITNFRSHIDLGMGFSCQTNGAMINFRFGYLFPLEKVRWKMNDNQMELTNSPSIYYNYYFSIIVGMGYMDVH
ncbi:MAG: hypothetical protein FWH18_04560 [Marinilabiliaceae bacterium]|nr:hypothetical protein [Marinilabiliaceae bacterium]